VRKMGAPFLADVARSGDFVCGAADALVRRMHTPMHSLKGKTLNRISLLHLGHEWTRAVWNSQEVRFSA